GRRIAYLLADNDQAGREHVLKVAEALRGDVPEIRIVSFPELPEKGDVSDWLAQGHNGAELLARARAGEVPPPPRRYKLISASDIVATPLDWLWEDHLLRGSLEIMTGLPGEGKSQVQCQYVACVTTGRDWPDGKSGIERGSAIMLTAEDNLAQIVKPRL